MRFKSNKQRKAMFASIYGKSNKTYSQLKRSGSGIKPYADSDRDGVKNIKDCRPLNPKKQGFLHDIYKQKKEEFKQRQAANKIIQQKVQAARLKAREEESIKEAIAEEKYRSARKLKALKDKEARNRKFKQNLMKSIKKAFR